MIVLRLFLTFAKIGAFTFGGGYAMIPLMQREIIDTARWLTMKEFADIIAIAEMTPGPVAVNSATYVGYKVAGIGGAAAATTGVVFPSFVIVLTLAALFFRFKDSRLVRAATLGIRPAVAALIGAAAISVARVAFVDVAGPLVTLFVLVAVYRARLHPILAIVLAGALGLILY